MQQGLAPLDEQDIYALSTTKQVQYGRIGVAPDGTLFRYVGFGGTSTIAPGLLMTAAPYTANFVGLAITATTVSPSNAPAQTTASLTLGSTYLLLTNGATTVTQDMFAEGYLEVTQTSGSNNGPQRYRILGNTAATASTGYIGVFLYQSDPLRNASVLVAGTDTATVYPHPASAVQASTTIGESMGVTPMQVVNTSTVTNYGWVQITGTTLLTNDSGGNLTVGEGIAQSSTTAGNIVAVAATTFQIGQTQKAFNASTTGPCKINLL